MSRRTMKTAIALIAAGAVSFGFAAPALASAGTTATTTAISASSVDSTQTLARKLQAGQTVSTEVDGRMLTMQLVNGTVRVSGIDAELDGKSCFTAWIVSKALNTSTGKKVIETAMAISAATGVEKIEFMGYKFTLENAMELLMVMDKGYDAIYEIVAETLC